MLFRSLNNGASYDPLLLIGACKLHADWSDTEVLDTRAGPWVDAVSLRGVVWMRRRGRESQRCFESMKSVIHRAIAQTALDTERRFREPLKRA